MLQSYRQYNRPPQRLKLNPSQGWKFALVFSVWLMGCSGPLKAVQSSATPSQSAPPPVQASLGQNLPISARATIGGQVIQLEVARTVEQQAMGLMYRKSLADDRGMLFPFNPPRPVNFWMKNVAINLDMIFLRDGQVQAIAANVPPCREIPCPTYGPGATAIDQVIELRGGRASELGLKVGDRIAVEFLDPDPAGGP